MKISIVQHPPIYLDLEKSMARAIELVQESAAMGCGMVVFPEAWLPGYLRLAATAGGWDGQDG